MTQIRTAVRYAAGGEERIGRLDGETVIDAGPSGPRGFDASPEAWQAVEQAAGARHALADVTLLAPVVPRQVLCVGLNYKDHIAESGVAVPEHPIVFAKLPSAIVGPGAPIVLPHDEPRPDYEAEVAIVIGAAARRLHGADARAAIGGVTAFNDVSGRHGQIVTGLGQWTRGKSFDTFGPLGPVVVHPDDVDLDDLDVRLVLNGETRQSSNTRHLLFGPEALIEWISAAATLQPGDVIATGTPGGVGDAADPPRYLRDGDRVEVEVAGVGTLANPVVAEDRAAGSPGETPAAGAVAR